MKDGSRPAAQEDRACLCMPRKKHGRGPKTALCVAESVGLLKVRSTKKEILRGTKQIFQACAVNTHIYLQ